MKRHTNKTNNIETQDFKKTDQRGRINLGTKYSDKEVKVAIVEVKDPELQNWERKEELEKQEHESRKRLWVNTENEASVLVTELFSEDEELGPKFEVSIASKDYGGGTVWYSSESLEDAIEKAKAYMENHAYGESEEDVGWTYQDRKELDRFRDYDY